MQLTTPEIELLNKSLRVRPLNALTTINDVYIFGRTYVVDYEVDGVRYYSTMVIRGNFHPERFVNYWSTRRTEIDGVRYQVDSGDATIIERFPNSEIQRIDDQFNLPGSFRTTAGWRLGSHYFILGTHQKRLTQVMFPRASKMSVEEGLALSLEIGNYIRVEEVDDIDTECVLDIDGYRIIGAPDRH